MTRVITQPVALDELDLRFSSLRLVVPGRLSQLKASVERRGFVSGVVAATAVEPGRRVLVDGFKRVRVARELGLREVSTLLLALTGPDALAMMLVSNAQQRGMSALEQGWVVQRLCREHGLTQAQAGALLEHDQSWVSHRLRLVEHLDEGLQDDLRLGLLTPAVARELGRLPLSLQRSAAEAVREYGLRSRQAARLVRVLLATADPRARHDVLANPMAHVAVGKAQGTDRRSSPGGNELRQCLRGFEGAAWRLGNIVARHASGLHGEEARLLQPHVGQALAAGRKAVAQLDALCGAKGAGDAPPAK